MGDGTLLPICHHRVSRRSWRRISRGRIKRFRSVRTHFECLHILWDASGDIPSALSAKCFDTVVCSNVLEHIEDDARALANMRRMLSGNGRLLLLVPAHQWLFCPIDEDLGHFRRYGRKPLRRLLEDSGFEVEHLIPHNSLGILGWLVKGKLLRYRYLSNRDIRRFDALVPLVRKVDPVMAPLWRRS